MLSTAEIVATAQQRLAAASDPINVFWYQVDGTQSRNGLHREVKTAGTSCIFPFVVAAVSRFRDADGLLDDVRSVLAEMRSELLAAEAEIRASGRLALLLLSRSEFCLPQIASPIDLPDWFPIFAGQTTLVMMEDISWTGAVLLNSVVLKTEQLSRLLHEIDRILTRRVQANLAAGALSASIIQAFESGRYGLKEKGNQLAIADILLRFERALAAVSPQGYRPTTKGASSFVPKMLETFALTSPNDLLQHAKGLASVLAFPAGWSLPPRVEPLPVVMYQPTGKIWDTDARFCRSILVTVFSGCQLLMGSAHADRFGSFPARDLRATCYGLCDALDRQIKAIEALP